MKSLRIIGFVLTLLLIAANVFAPEVQAMVPPSVHDFVFGTDGVMLGMSTVSFGNFGRKERQKANLGGIAKLYLLSASDFTDDWPKASDVAQGVLSIAPPLKAGVTAATVTFDIGTCRVKSEKKGKLGYQNVSVSGECKMAGYEAGQMNGLQVTFNEGGVAIVVYKDGTRAVYGTKEEPLEFTDATDSGAKADDPLAIDFKFSGDGYAVHPPVLAATVTIPLPV